LADYQAKMDELKALKIEVVGLSVDPLEKSREVVEQSGLSYPLAYGLKVPEDAERIGAWWEERRGIIQPSEFLLDSSHRVASATYSTGPIGRVKAEDVIALVKFLNSRRQQQAQSGGR
jgi:peroxiredoxin